MRALTWQGRRDVRVETVPDPVISAPDDVVVRITSSGLCGSDLHLYEVLAPYLTPGDVLGHEPIGVVAETGPAVTELAVGDRVVVPFNVSCGTCWMCGRGLHSQCETTQNRDTSTGASLFGYTSLYGRIPGGQAEYLRVPFGNTLPIRVPDGPPDDRFVYLSDVLPTAYQAVQYADPPRDGTVVVLGLGPIGDMCTRIARHLGVRQVVGVDRVPERLRRAELRGTTTLDVRSGAREVRAGVDSLTEGRGADAVIDAVGMEAHGSPVATAGQRLAAALPAGAGRKLMETAGIDRTTALYLAIDLVRRGGTLSLAGVYGGTATPVPLLTLFDKQVQVRMGQANVWRWVPDLLPLLGDDDPLGVDEFATHRLPLEQAPEAYRMFQEKRSGAVKILFTPGPGV
ncbi:alcohol dehydrogenase catalytic domain-containing protein [Pseudonocardia sp. C8]|uniref:alcohol dehydrogenase catalytic domain-containing protein n=1 Tax=Pseudonocardia sp. C8 TaxID=2762759 RepID=UPI0016426CA8|nr:alcohol dehydrogenase catalytic domain-containing protein [Pseudonocardia sp. C8]MBC3192294.1 alcohol dehydrogenase catalytic domain-containing protein [Pseudonocardia sp. C8]